MRIKAIVRYHCTFGRITIIIKKKRQIITRTGEDMEKLVLSCTADGKMKWWDNLGK